MTAPLPQNGESDAPIVPRQLLGPAPKGKLFALSIRPQIEGLAVARGELDPAAAKVGRAAWARRRIENLEVAWDNLEEGSTTRAVLAGAGSLRPYSIYGTAKDGFTFVPDMLSVSPKGLFVRGSSEDRSAYFVDTAGKVKAFRYPESPLELLDGALLDADDAVHVDGTFLPTAQLGSDHSGRAPRSRCSSARPPAGAKPTDALGHVGHDARARRRSPREPLHALRLDLRPRPPRGVGDAPRARRRLRRRLDVDGAGERHARRPDAPPHAARPAAHPRAHAPPRSTAICRASGCPSRSTAAPCSPARATPSSSPRSPPQASPPSPIPGLASRAAPPKPAVIGRAALLTTGYVLRGTPIVPLCLDAIAARGTDDPLTATLLMGDLQRGWYFRVASRDIEVRPLTCRFDPGATVPTSVLEANARPTAAPARR